MKVFLGQYFSRPTEKESVEAIAKEFQKQDIVEVLERASDIFAWYGCDNYSGDAIVIYKLDNTWYEVHGSHCSCFGIEDQWNPEETHLDSIRLRKPEDQLSYYCGAVESDMEAYTKFVNEAK